MLVLIFLEREEKGVQNSLQLDAIIVDFSKAFDLVPHGRLLTKTANSGVESRVVVWIRNSFLVARRESGEEGNCLQKLE